MAKLRARSRPGLPGSVFACLAPPAGELKAGVTGTSASAAGPAKAAAAWARLPAPPAA